MMYRYDACACTSILLLSCRLLRASDTGNCGLNESVICAGTANDARQLCPLGISTYHSTPEEREKYQLDIKSRNQSGIWQGYFSPGAWFNLKGDVIKWGDWAISFSDFADPNKDCIHLTDEKKWLPGNCKESRHGLCQNENTCREKIKRGCLWISNLEASMEEVEKDCNSENGTLAFFTKETWNDFVNHRGVYRYFMNTIPFHGSWLGIRKTQVIWGTHTGEDLALTNWQIGEPKLSRNNHCAIIPKAPGSTTHRLLDFEWITEDCSETHFSVLCWSKCRNNGSLNCYYLMDNWRGGNITSVSTACKKAKLFVSRFDSLNYMKNVGFSWTVKGPSWIHVTNRLWYTLTGDRVTGLLWQEDKPVIMKENKHCVRINITNSDVHSALIEESNCVVDANEASYGLCEIRKNSSDKNIYFYLRSTSKHTNINDAHQDCRNQGGMLVVPDSRFRNLPIPNLENGEYWVGITDEPRFWYSWEGERVDIIAMGTDEQMCLKMVHNRDDKYILIPTNCTEENIIYCAPGTHITTIAPATSVGLNEWCECPCPKINDKVSSLAEKIAEIKESVVKELGMEPEQLSATTRKYVSAPDNRPSSKYIGSTAIIIVTVTVTLIIIPDLINLIKFIKRKMKHKCKWR